MPHNIGPLHPSLPYLPRHLVSHPPRSIRIYRSPPEDHPTYDPNSGRATHRTVFPISAFAYDTPGRRFFRIMNFQSAQTHRLCRPLFRHVCCQCVLDLIHLTNVRLFLSHHWLSQACLLHHYGLPSERLLLLAGRVQHRGDEVLFPRPSFLTSHKRHVRLRSPARINIHRNWLRRDCIHTLLLTGRRPLQRPCSYYHTAFRCSALTPSRDCTQSPFQANLLTRRFFSETRHESIRLERDQGSTRLPNRFPIFDITRR